MSEKLNKITRENWTYTYYSTGDLRAFVSLGGRPHPTKPKLVIEEFSVTLTQGDEFSELFQNHFESLEEALAVINKRYYSWGHKQLTSPESSASHGGCAAH